MSSRKARVAGAITAAVIAGLSGGAIVRADTPPQPTYRANDYSAPIGNPPTALNILPAGENGLATATDIGNFEGQPPSCAASMCRPPYSHDQYDMYQNLLYNVSGLTDAALGQYYKDASFGIASGDLDTTRTVTLSPSVGSVSIYRDLSHGVPHIYGTTIPAMAYGAGYAAAADRLFLIDILRHLGRGHLAEFIGNSCSIERGDYAQRLIADYTAADKVAQINSIAASGPVGAELFSMATAFAQGVNQYVTEAQSDSSKLPGDYAVASPVSGLPILPQNNWSASDIIDIASLVGGIFGKGGGNEFGNAALYKYLVGVLGSSSALTALHDFKETNDPQAPTTLNGVSFPYDTQQPASLDPTLNAITDSANLTGQKQPTGTGCGGTNTLFGGLPHVNMSNALLVSGSHTTDGHPIAVIGPQVGYYAPQILMENDLHAPDYDARGTSFPGTNFLVELGRGRDFAWTATSASSDVVDQKVVRVYNSSSCTSTDTTPANNLFYKFTNVCQPLSLISDTETATQTVACNPPPPSATNCLAGDVNLDHSTYRVLDDTGLNQADHVMGIVQGWTTVSGNPVVVYNQRSTYFHELDSGIGFDMWQHPSMTYDVNSWMVGASNIQYTFNWHYIDSQHIGYYVSGKDPLRNPAVDPALPTWGGGAAEWQGFLDFNGHPHQADPPQGYLVQWNNKPAPGFAAADDVYNYGLVHRQQLLVAQLQAQFTANGGHISRANLVQAMETAASQDLSAVSVMPEVMPLLGTFAAGPQAMLDHINAWVAAGAHRQKNAHADAEYTDPSAVGAMDELYPRVVEALFGGVFSAGGTPYQNHGIDAGYNVLPMGFAGLPNSHGGSSYGSGWEGYVVKALRQVRGIAVTQPFSTPIANLLCTTGAGNCPAALANAVVAAYNAMVTANGGSTNVATWTKNTAINSAGGTFGSFDNIQFTAAGVIGQPAFDWQNRPTFQQVVEFQNHAPLPGNALPEFPLVAGIALGVGALAAVSVGRRRRRATTTS